MATATTQTATKATRKTRKQTRERIDVRLRREQKDFIEKAAHIKALPLRTSLFKMPLKTLRGRFATMKSGL